MSEEDTISHFENELDALIERFRLEYDMTYAVVIGCLHLKAHEVSKEALENAGY